MNTAERIFIAYFGKNTLEHYKETLGQNQLLEDLMHDMRIIADEYEHWLETGIAPHDNIEDFHQWLNIHAPLSTDPNPEGETE